MGVVSPSRLLLEFCSPRQALRSRFVSPNAAVMPLDLEAAGVAPIDDDAGFTNEPSHEQEQPIVETDPAVREAAERRMQIARLR